MNPLGAEDYREGSLLRLKEAKILYASEKWVGAIYLAGRAVEALFRCLLWRQSKEQEIGHDLKKMLTRVRSWDLLPQADEMMIRSCLNKIAVIWRNDLRFTGDERFYRILKQSKRDQGIGKMPVKGDPAKANAKIVLEACETIIAIGEPLCCSKRS